MTTINTLRGRYMVLGGYIRGGYDLTKEIREVTFSEDKYRLGEEDKNIPGRGNSTSKLLHRSKKCSRLQTALAR